MPNPRASDSSVLKVAPPVPQPNGMTKGSMSAAVAAAAASAPSPAPAPPAFAPVSATYRGERYENGIVTACNNLTYDEVMRRRLIGLPRAQYDLMKQLKHRASAIFLLNMETRELFGVFEAEGRAGMDIEPTAWNSGASGGSGRHGRTSSRFPAQCSFSIAADFESPLSERHYRDILAGSDRKQPRIRLLNADEVRKLIKIFQQKSKLRKLPVAAGSAASTAASAAASGSSASSAASAPSISTFAASATSSRRNSVDSSVSEEERGQRKRKGVIKVQATCKRWLADECQHSEETCKYLHVATVCRAYQRGVCRVNPCPFIHDKQDRENYRLGRPYIQKTAVHPEAQTVASTTATAASAGASKAKPAQPKDSLDSILSGLGSWKLAGKKTEHTQDATHPATAAATTASIGSAHGQQSDTLSADSQLSPGIHPQSRLHSQPTTADDEDAYVQALEASISSHHPSSSIIMPPQAQPGGVTFEHANHDSHSRSSLAHTSASRLFLNDGLSFEMSNGSNGSIVGGLEGSSSSASASLSAASLGGWKQFDGVPSLHAFDHGLGTGVGVGVGVGAVNAAQHHPHHGGVGAFDHHSHGGDTSGSMFFSPSPEGHASAAQQHFQQQQHSSLNDDHEYPWFTNFRMHVVQPAMQTLHQREQQAGQKLIGPD